MNSIRPWLINSPVQWSIWERAAWEHWRDVSLVWRNPQVTPRVYTTSHLTTSNRYTRSHTHNQNTTVSIETLFVCVLLCQILNAAYHVEVTFHSGSSVTRQFWEQIKQVPSQLPTMHPALHSMMSNTSLSLFVYRLFTGSLGSILRLWLPSGSVKWLRTPSRVSALLNWPRASVHSSELDSTAHTTPSPLLSDRSNTHALICEEVRSVCLFCVFDHKRCVCVFVCVQLEEGHTGRLERTEDLWLRVRKDHAPRLARLSLESRSLRDIVLNGTQIHTHKKSGISHLIEIFRWMTEILNIWLQSSWNEVWRFSWVLSVTAYNVYCRFNILPDVKEQFHWFLYICPHTH